MDLRRAYMQLARDVGTTLYPKPRARARSGMIVGAGVESRRCYCDGFELLSPLSATPSASSTTSTISGTAGNIIIETTSPPVAGWNYPLCAAGERACPPEDVGGQPGYEEFLTAIADPAHEEHDDMLVWVGGLFDPEGFDINCVNRGLRRRRLCLTLLDVDRPPRVTIGPV